MKKLREGQRGFTLIELLIAIVIAGLITGGITFAIMQLLTINTRASNHMVAVRQVQQAGKEVSKDTLQAQNVTVNNATGSRGFPLTLNWTVNNSTHGVIYSLNGTGDLRTLQRKYYFNSALNSTTTVAEYIALNQTTCAPPGPLPRRAALNFTVTATVGDQSETRLYEVQPRPGS